MPDARRTRLSDHRVRSFVYGEGSGGEPRNLTSPEISTEDFSAAVDYLLTRDDVNAQRIGILGICGWGGFALNAAANDPRIKATVASTMYDMSRVNANGYFDADDNADARYELRRVLNEQRTEDYRNGAYERNGGVVDPLPEDAPLSFVNITTIIRPNAATIAARPPNEGINKTAALAFINMPIATYIGEIRSAVLLVHGEKRPFARFQRRCYKRLTGDNKELLIVPGANHTDLYDNLDMIRSR